MGIPQAPKPHKAPNAGPKRTTSRTIPTTREKSPPKGTHLVIRIEHGLKRTKALTVKPGGVRLHPTQLKSRSPPTHPHGNSEAV